MPAACSSAWYELRTSGPDSTWRKPIASAASLQVRELVRVPVALDGQVLGRGTEVLADGEDVDAGAGEALRTTSSDLRPGLAEAEHDAALGERPGVELLRAAQQLERTSEAGLRAGRGGRAAAPFPCCGSGSRAGRGDHGGQRVPVALEIGDEHLDRRAGAERAASSGWSRRRSRRRRRAASSRLTLVMTAWRRPMRWTATATRAGSPWSSAPRAAGLDRAEAAGARADVAQDHEGGGAAAPALADVRAARLFADGVEILVAHERAQPFEVPARGEADLQPGRPGGLDGHDLRVADGAGGPADCSSRQSAYSLILLPTDGARPTPPQGPGRRDPRARCHDSCASSSRTPAPSSGRSRLSPTRSSRMRSSARRPSAADPDRRLRGRLRGWRAL